MTSESYLKAANPSFGKKSGSGGSPLGKTPTETLIRPLGGGIDLRSLNSETLTESEGITSYPDPRGESPGFFGAHRTARLPKKIAEYPYILSLSPLGGQYFAALVADALDESGKTTVKVVRRSLSGSEDSYPIASGGRELLYRRTVIPFEAYNFGGSQTTHPKLLVFPDRILIPLEPPFQPENLSTIRPTVPTFECGTIYEGRLFGSFGNILFASRPYRPTDWKTDLEAGEESEDNAFLEAYYPEPNASGNVTGLIPFRGKLLLMKENLLCESLNKKNPFRFEAIAPVGPSSIYAHASTPESVFFASKTGIYRYSGSLPERISDPLPSLNITVDSSLGCDLTTLYFSDRKKVYTFDLSTEQWGTLPLSGITQFITVGGKCLSTNGKELFFMGEGDFSPFSFTAPFPMDSTLLESEARTLTLSYSHPSHASGDSLTLSLIAHPSGEVSELGTFSPTGPEEPLITLNLPPLRGSSFSLRLSGKGNFIFGDVSLTLGRTRGTR